VQPLHEGSHRGSVSSVETSFVTSLSADRRVLSVAGVLDELSVDDFRSALRDAIDSSEGTLEVDLSQVDFLPMLAMGILVGAMQRCPSVRIVAADGCLAARLLGLTGLPYSRSCTGPGAVTDGESGGSLPG
jgi:hypothetical protein